MTCGMQEQRIELRSSLRHGDTVLKNEFFRAVSL